ncbi:MAG TPA: GNAT family N-acetyltransferase [Micromonosporaceae bacterium]|nr:GNAT family N-acetyltransferase [Micromonosporaceae bacterium]
MTDPSTLLAAFDRQARTWFPDWVTVERDGPLLRVTELDDSDFITYPDLGGLTGADLDALIDRQRRGRQVEWKTYAHDEPADLGDRLRAAGFEPEERETVVVGAVASVAAALPVLPEGVRAREVTARADLDRAVSDRPHLAGSLEREIAADPTGITVVVAEADGEVVSSAWVRFLHGTAFATLWGGWTAPDWRRRGIYRALVTYRARLAHARGFTLLQVDAMDTSRPILEKMGFVAVTTTTPYVYTP